MTGERRSFWKENTVFGLLMGVGWCVASLVFLRWGKGMAMNPALNNVLVMMAIAGVYLGLRDYRERGYGEAFGSGDADSDRSDSQVGGGGRDHADGSASAERAEALYRRELHGRYGPVDCGQIHGVSER